ncbi:MAG TPA: glycosyltransferase family 4 protein [Sphingomicrobium sp.]|nr:glycosyltransferase family 4 protein [Sphingomicrobium sp.]
MEASASRTILIAGNTSWYLWNFRRNVIAALTAQGMDVTVVAPADEYSKSLAALPRVRWVDWPLALYGANPIQELTSLLRFARIVRHVRPDFVINHGIKANVYGGLTCRRMSVPYANSVTGLGMMLAKSGLGPWALGKLYAFACNRARVLFIQNNEDLAVLRQAGLSGNIPTVRTLGSGVDLAHFKLASIPSCTSRIFLFVGRLQRDKGIWDFIDAARAVRSEFPDARFIVVGSQAFANRGGVPSDVLDDWKREGLVELAGHQDDVRPWLASAHVLVLPSHGGEGVPKVLLEAAATGRPIVSSDVTGCRDAVIDGETGYLFPVGNVEALVEAMSRFCEATDDQLAAMGRAARRDAEARFSDSHLIQETIAAVTD